VSAPTDVKNKAAMYMSVFILLVLTCAAAGLRMSAVSGSGTAAARVPFVKYHGLGNDFILVDNTKSATPIFTPQDAVRLCDRNFGIGGDGLIFVLPGREGCDYTMRIYNNDGSEPQMCGNGIRCMARFLHEVVESKAPGSEQEYKIWTNAGQIVPQITAGGLITVDMGRPILSPASSIPTTLPATRDDGKVVSAALEAGGHLFEATAVSMGNPHVVMFVENLDTMSPPFATVGPLVEKHATFPQRVNAEFVQVLSRSHLKMKVWERGAGPTLACGTGACATVVAGVLTGRCERQCKVTLPGGDLDILWDETSDKIYMTGPAVAVFAGNVA